MKRTGRVPLMDLKIGILVLIAFGLVVWATFQSGSFKIGREENVKLTFPSVGGLEEGAPVRLNGVPVGVVREIRLAPDKNHVEAILGVKTGTRARLHQGSQARITTLGFLADLYVALETGDESKPVIASDDEIRTFLASDPQQMMGRVEGIADSLTTLLGSLNKAGRNLSGGRGTLGQLATDDRLYDELLDMTRNATALTKRLEETQSKVAGRMISIAGSLDSLTASLQHGEGTAGQLIRDRRLYDHMIDVTGRMDSVLTVIESGRGNVGKLMADSTLYEDTRALVGSMKRLMSEIEKNPKKYFKFSIF
ncbi:MAG TPA: MlaD family protein [Acidobacteriota bacterium]|nr:MlaD family protein [Acidobacteriota bacterium]